MDATFEMFSALATDVPPNFNTCIWDQGLKMKKIPV
jgi:hypothetical protein